VQTRMIIVSGSPGSGKTGLAEKLGDTFEYPVLSRDALKEVLMDIWPPESREESERLGDASWPLMYQVLDALLGRIPGVIVESNFVRGDTESGILKRLERAQAILVHCAAKTPEIIERIADRKNDHSRHEGHFDEQIVPDVVLAIDNDAYEPLDLPIPLIHVNTTDGYDPSLEDIARRIEETLAS